MRGKSSRVLHGFRDRFRGGRLYLVVIDCSYTYVGWRYYSRGGYGILRVITDGGKCFDYFPFTGDEFLAFTVSGYDSSFLVEPHLNLDLVTIEEVDMTLINSYLDSLEKR